MRASEMPSFRQLSEPIICWLATAFLLAKANTPRTLSLPRQSRSCRNSAARPTNGAPKCAHRCTGHLRPKSNSSFAIARQMLPFCRQPAATIRNNPTHHHSAPKEFLGVASFNGNRAHELGDLRASGRSTIHYRKAPVVSCLSGRGRCISAVAIDDDALEQSHMHHRMLQLAHELMVACIFLRSQLHILQAGHAGWNFITDLLVLIGTHPMFALLPSTSQTQLLGRGRRMPKRMPLRI